MMDSTTLKRMAGYLGLAAALPLAIIGATLPVNEFRAQGFAALDYDGPIEVAIVAVPALLIYGTGALLFSRDAPETAISACGALLRPRRWSSHLQPHRRRARSLPEYRP